MNNNIKFCSNFKNIIFGFCASCILTIVSFGTAILYFEANKNFIKFLISIFAILQAILHVIFFLHIDLSFKEKWNLVSLIFTLIIILILIFGSLWIMNHLYHNINL